jgi:hypothetical protein
LLTSEADDHQSPSGVISISLTTVSGQEPAIEFLFELLLQLILEIAGQALFELLTAFGWESLRNSTRRERDSTPVLAVIGHLLAGLAAGVVSVLIVPRRLALPSPLPGVSLVLSPIGTGLVMQWIGELSHKPRSDRPALFSFQAGAIFAFGMSLIRFVCIEIGWRPL